jgi:predicted phage-related endonuclease
MPLHTVQKMIANECVANWLQIDAELREEVARGDAERHAGQHLQGQVAVERHALFRFCGVGVAWQAHDVSF